MRLRDLLDLARAVEVAAGRSLVDLPEGFILLHC